MKEAGLEGMTVRYHEVSLTNSGGEEGTNGCVAPIDGELARFGHS